MRRMVGRDRAAAGLGRVRGEDGVEPQRLQARATPPRRRARRRAARRRPGSESRGPLAASRGAARARGGAPRRGSRGGSSGEGPGDLLGALLVELRDDLAGAVDRLGGVRLAGVARGRVLVGGDDGGAQALDVGQQVGAAGLGEHAPEQAAQEAHVGAQVGVDRPPDVVSAGSVGSLRGVGVGHGTIMDETGGG